MVSNFKPFSYRDRRIKLSTRKKNKKKIKSEFNKLPTPEKSEAFYDVINNYY